MKKLIALCLVFVIAVTLLAGCSAGSKKLVMATNAQFAPFESKDGDKFVGIDVDMANEIAKDLGKELQIDDMEFNSIITAVSSGKADMGVAGMTVTEDRLKNVDFSDPYFEAAQVVIVKQGSTVTADKLDGMRIGVQDGTTGDTYAQENYKSATISKYPSGVDAVLALKSDKTDAVIIDNYTAKALAKQNPDVTVLEDKLTSENYAIAVKKGNKQLLDSINKTIARLKSDGSLDKFIDNNTSK